MNASVAIFAFISTLAASPALAQTPTPCKALDPAPLIGDGILGTSEDTIAKGVWFESERGFGTICKGRDDPDQECTFNDPGMIRVNVQGVDHFYASPAGMIVKLTVRHDTGPECEITGVAPPPPPPPPPQAGYVSPARLHVVGYGLVVGLNHTGEDLKTSSSASEALKELFAQQGMGLYDTTIFDGRVAVVLVTSNVYATPKAGMAADLTVTAPPSVSLQGGALLTTRLYGADARVYALGQGVLQPCREDEKPPSKDVDSACISGGAITTQ